MSNEILWIILLFSNFAMLTLFYRLFGTIGLYIWTAMSVILANIQVIKIIDLFGFTTSMGNIIYSSTFLVTDILSENHKKEDAKKAVLIGFAVLIATTLIMQLSLRFNPNPEDISQQALSLIFGFLPRIALASLIAYLISQNIDIWLYHLIRKYASRDTQAWIRNNGSTLVSQFIDNTVFTLLAFYGVYNWDIILEIFMVSYILKFIIAICDTPFVYLAKWMKQKNLIPKPDVTTTNP